MEDKKIKFLEFVEKYFKKEQVEGLSIIDIPPQHPLHADLVLSDMLLLIKYAL